MGVPFGRAFRLYLSEGGKDTATIPNANAPHTHRYTYICTDHFHTFDCKALRYVK